MKRCDGPVLAAYMTVSSVPKAFDPSVVWIVINRTPYVRESLHAFSAEAEIKMRSALAYIDLGSMPAAWLQGFW